MAEHPDFKQTNKYVMFIGPFPRTYPRQEYFVHRIRDAPKGARPFEELLYMDSMALLHLRATTTRHFDERCFGKQTPSLEE